MQNEIFEKNSLWQKATKQAAHFHRSQMRKDGKTPYIVHPSRVALTLTVVFKLYDPVILAAALLHDVIEDTTGDFDDIANLCGAEVACIVASLTKDTRIPEKKREEVYKRQLETSDWRTKIIKLADIYDNLCDAQESGVKVNVFSDAEFMLNSCRNDSNLALAVKELELLMDYLKALH